MSDFDAKEVIQRIEKRLIELGMSKDEFYERSGISSASFSQWNTGKHSPTPKKLSAVAKTLQISAEYLLTGEQKESPRQETREIGPNKQALLDVIDKMSEAEMILLLERANRIIESRG